MAVHVNDLESVVIEGAKSSDEIIIISGYCSPDVIEKIAKLGKRLDFYLGMSQRGGLTALSLEKLRDLDRQYQHLNIYVVFECERYKKKKETQIETIDYNGKKMTQRIKANGQISYSLKGMCIGTDVKTG